METTTTTRVQSEYETIGIALDCSQQVLDALIAEQAKFEARVAEAKLRVQQQIEYIEYLETRRVEEFHMGGLCGDPDCGFVTSDGFACQGADQ